MIARWWRRRRARKLRAAIDLEYAMRRFQYNQAVILAQGTAHARIPEKREFFPPPAVDPLPGDGERYDPNAV